MASGEPTSPAGPPPPSVTQSSPRVYRHNVDGLSDIADHQERRFARDIERKVVGPMPVDLFLETFFPHPTEDIPPLKDVNFTEVPGDPHKESEIYSPLMNALNKVLKDSNPKLAFYDTSNRAESPGKVGSSKPDLCMFHEDDMGKGNTKSVRKPSETAPGGYVYTARMGEVHMFIEVKTSHNLDPFTDPPDGDIPPEYRFTIDTSNTYSDDKNARYRVAALGQSTRYAHIIQTRQFRTGVYSMSVAGTTARLLRWDRSGVIVTESFNYKSNSKSLADFVWRFSKATDEQCGFDCSAVIIHSPKDEERFVDAIRGHVQGQLPGLSAKDIRSGVDKHYSPKAITQLTVGTGVGARSFWVSRPMFTSKGVTGRSTRGYWGVGCESDEVVFVKDVWRTDVLGVQMEGAILEELLKAKVRNIPELVCHGDVLHDGGAQTTQTDKFAREDWVKISHPVDNRYRPIPRKHYRLVLKVAGLPLSTFNGTRELLSATYDILIAVMDAHSIAKTLHRDLSLGNIILYKAPNQQIRVGYLIDWELGCKIDRLTVRDHVLMGTPAFMSIAVSNPDTAHVHAMKDDLESLLYVVLYCALLWLPVESSSGLNWWLSDFFCPHGRGGEAGAPVKLLNAATRFYTGGLRSAQGQAVLDWLNAAMDLHYCPMGGPNPGPNPVWDDGNALKTMWEETLTKDLPNDDWHENTIPDTVLREDGFLHATHTVSTTPTAPREPHDTSLQQPLATSSKHTLSVGTDESADLFKGDSKRRRLSSGQEGERTEHNVMSLPRVSVVEGDSPETSPTRNRKIQPTASQILMPPPPAPGPSHPISTGGRVTRSSARATPTTVPTSEPATTPVIKKLSRRGNQLRKEKK